MTKNGKNLARRATNLLVLFALILGTVVPSFAATQRRRVRRRAPVARRTTPTTPPVRYYTVPANRVIRVRIDTEFSSKAARRGDRFSATVTEPVYGGGSGVDVVPT